MSISDSGSSGRRKSAFTSARSTSAPPKRFLAAAGGDLGRAQVGLAVADVELLPVRIDRPVVSRTAGLQARSRDLVRYRRLGARWLQGVLPPSRRPVTLQATGSVHLLAPGRPARHRWFHLHVVRRCVAYDLVCPLHPIQHRIVFHHEGLGLLARELRQLVRARLLLIPAIVYSVVIPREQIALAVYPVAHWPGRVVPGASSREVMGLTVLQVPLAVLLPGRSGAFGHDLVQGGVAWVDVHVAVQLLVLVEAAFPFGCVSYLDRGVLGDSATEVDRLLVDRVQVFWLVPCVLVASGAGVVRVVAVGPVVPLSARSILLQGIFFHLVVVEALVAEGSRPLGVALVEIGPLICLVVLSLESWVAVLLVFLALFQPRGLQGPRPRRLDRGRRNVGRPVQGSLDFCF